MIKSQLTVRLVLLLMLSILLVPISTSADGGKADYDIRNGHFYSQSNGAPPGVTTIGYAVTDEGADDRGQTIKFWSEFQRLGGVAAIGYPISNRFIWDGFVTQAFQKAIFQWRTERGQVDFINVFDELHDTGKDDFLFIMRSTPHQLGSEFDAGKSYAQVMRDRLALLDANPAIRAKYYEVATLIDPLVLYGLPASRVEDMGNHYALRLQRAVLQQWKQDVPWAKAGQVTVANGGDIAKEVGLIDEQDAQAGQPIGSLPALESKRPGVFVSRDGGIPAIQPRTIGTGPTVPTYPQQDVEQYVHTHPMQGYRITIVTAPNPSITSITLMTVKDFSARYRYTTDRLDPALLIYAVELQGRFTFYGGPWPGRLGTYYTGVEVFDAHSGNILIEGGIDK